MTPQSRHRPTPGANRTRCAAALILGLLLCAATVIPFVLAINRFDWGVGLLLAAPLLVWVLLRSSRALERWARNERGGDAPDPDFPD
ncbi:MAG: hypothetical protein KDI01_10645 [Halioglobus sp.]|nr:hypothetical protein [Halioglobus sp.]